MNEQNEIDFTEIGLVGMTPQQAADAVIRQASRLSASDLFVLTDEDAAIVAMRRLGAVETIARVSGDQGRQLINLIKAAAGMDLAERRRPLDGRMIYESDDLKLDLRINTIPTLFGEDMTCRLLDRRVSLMNLDQLGMSSHEMAMLSVMLASPSGLILVTGPTGTGKTTTLYAALQHLNDGTRKINTLEDPIEYAVAGLRQSQVNPKLELHFADLLRNVLRQAPDVIMVGEIRDEETATTAVRAASSGHLVLATLHAPVASGAVQSMLALGAHPYFLASSLLGVVAQRLIRVLCPACRVRYDISDSPGTFAEIESLLDGDDGKAIFGPGGCPECRNGGYSKRTGLFEVMPVNREIRRLIVEGRPSKELEDKAIAAGMIEFHRAALLKVAQGVTSTEEMMRSVPSEYLGLDE